MPSRCTTEVLRNDYSEFCYSSCFDNTNVFQHDWHIRGQFEHNTNVTSAMCDSVCKTFLKQKTTPSSTEPCRDTQNVSTSNINLLCPFTGRAKSHIHNFPPYLESTLHHHCCPHASTFLTYTSKANLQSLQGNTPYTLQYLCVSQTIYIHETVPWLLPTFATV